MKYKAIYWVILSPFIKKFLKLHFSKEDYKVIMIKAKDEYISLLAKADDIGEDNPMASNLYFALLFLSFHTFNPNVITEDMLREMIRFVLTDKILLKLMKADLNKERDMKNLRKKMEIAHKWSEENKDKHPETWQFVFDNSHKDGIYYYFTKCPIAKFFKDNNLSHLTHIFCEIDYLNLENRGGRLIRNNTIADGADICDFWILPDKIKNPK